MKEVYSINKKLILNNINLQLTSNEKIIIQGNNGSGKSTLLKAILNNSLVVKEGVWLIPHINDIGYIDQYYSNLPEKLTAVEILEKVVPLWSYTDIRNHLNDFLLRKNEEVNLSTKYLSGGEKARLSIAIIAAKIPKLLILDEITNNIDLETKEHLIQVLSKYLGSIILVCHDRGFTNSLNINKYGLIENGSLKIL